MPRANLNDRDYVRAGANLATTNAGDGGYGIVTDDAVAVRSESIAWIGPGDKAQGRAAARGRSLRGTEGSWIMPGLIDCPTHLVYAGGRSREFELRQQGATYAGIACCTGVVYPGIWREAQC